MENKELRRILESVYDESEEAREEEYSKHVKLKKHILQRGLCERCEKISYKQLVLYRSSWDRICEKLRMERPVSYRYNRNILLCPECMEELNGGKFKKTEVPGYPCNEWYEGV